MVGHDQNSRELSLNVKLRFAIGMKRESCECQFSLFFVVLGEKLANFCMISLDLAKIEEICRERDFTI